MSEIETLIKVENLSKSYQKNGLKLEIIKSVSFSLKRGLLTAITGESGAGKSTLLYLISGLLKPCEGKVYFQDQSIYDLKDNAKAKLINSKIGYVFQDYQLLSNLTVLENIYLPAKLKSIDIPSSQHYQKKAKDLLAQFNLSHRLAHYPFELSGGEQQRVAILRALINEPEIIFCDEPTGNLDSHNAEIFINTILDFKAKLNQTFVIVSHNEKFVRIADEIFHIKDGMISLLVA